MAKQIRTEMEDKCVIGNINNVYSTSYKLIVLLVSLLISVKAGSFVTHSNLKQRLFIWSTFLITIIIWFLCFSVAGETRSEGLPL